MGFGAYGSLPFTEAIRFLRNKHSVPTERYTDVWKDAHDTAFMVAGAAKADLLADLRGAVETALVEGKTLAWFQENFNQIVANYGWEHTGPANWRSRVIYETNLKTAWAAGRYEQMTDPEMMARRPYWQYRHGGSADPREEHLAWNGLTLAADDPWWDEHYPPNGWGCNCSVVTLSERDMETMGLTVGSAPQTDYYEWTDPKTGEGHKVPEGIDPGWDYAPGKNATNRPDIADQMRDKADRLDDDLGDKLRRRIDLAGEQDPGPAPGDRGDDD